MKINYLTPFAEERVLSIEAYVNDLIQFQKNYSPKFEISKYIPKINIPKLDLPDPVRLVVVKNTSNENADMLMQSVLQEAFAA